MSLQGKAAMSLWCSPVKQQNRKVCFVMGLPVGASARAFSSYIVKYSLKLGGFLNFSFPSSSQKGVFISNPSLTAWFSIVLRLVWVNSSVFSDNANGLIWRLGILIDILQVGKQILVE